MAAYSSTTRSIEWSTLHGANGRRERLALPPIAGNLGASACAAARALLRTLVRAFPS